ncbi:hypothetical protein PFICI_06349 [Pestalotiopsis fici W106-1]|uniref:Uncharacterized protein n=1 Tax=Pestalotiopsis fici (strain W106-1 / CGMCC3.15140) TaxID=1229662 RepID=W3X7I7_PESFW|nr:uncharacterized protein PFICI_06349 [Pestalotiopsis fici W106-1]ETS81347.1 hypothetical protein PFICI_06349 [Pestalotiopsis fici W106-1]
MSNIINKVKDALHSDKDKTHEAPQGSHGPHNSRVANTADPRVDSDRDHRANPTTHYGEGAAARPHEGVGSTGFGSTGTHTGTHTGAHTGTHAGGIGSTGAYDTAEGVHGPHGSRMANAADPRIDSDRDHRGAPGHTTGLGSSGLGSNTHSGIGATGTHGTHGTHSSGLTGSTGYGSNAPEGTYGTHNSRVANAADPRIDSDRDHRGTAATSHVGPAQNTAGPHKSDMLNKVDPRVDSDLDGSKTVGKDQTHRY